VGYRGAGGNGGAPRWGWRAADAPRRRLTRGLAMHGGSFSCSTDASAAACRATNRSVTSIGGGREFCSARGGGAPRRLGEAVGVGQRRRAERGVGSPGG